MAAIIQVRLATKPVSSTTPTLASASINTAGTQLTLNFSISCTNGAGGSGGVTLSATGGAVTATYSSGSPGGAFIYTLSRTVNSGETVTVSYTQPGNGIEATTGGIDMATFATQPVTNNSTAGSGPAVITAHVVSAIGPTSGSTITQSVDATGATALVVFFYAYSVTAFTGVSATYNGSAMTIQYLCDSGSSGGTTGAIYQGCFVITSPTTGSHNVVITFTGGAIDYTAIISAPMSGVNTSTPTGTGTANGSVVSSVTTATATVTSASGELVVSSLGLDSAVAVTPGGGQTVIATITDNTGGVTFTANYQAGAASTSASWSFASTRMECGAVPMKP